MQHWSFRAWDLQSLGSQKLGNLGPWLLGTFDLGIQKVILKILEWLWRRILEWVGRGVGVGCCFWFGYSRTSLSSLLFEVLLKVWEWLLRGIWGWYEGVRR